MNTQLSRVLSLAALTSSVAALSCAAYTVIDTFDNVAGNNYWNLNVSSYSHSRAFIGDDFYQQGYRAYQLTLPQGTMDTYAYMYGTYTYSNGGGDVSGYGMGYDYTLQYETYSYYSYAAATNGEEVPLPIGGRSPGGRLEYSLDSGGYFDFSQDPGLQFDFSSINVDTAFKITLTDASGLISTWSGVFNSYLDEFDVAGPVSYNVPFEFFSTDPAFDLGQVTEASFDFNTQSDGAFSLSQIGSVQPIPEPGTYALLGLGLGAVGLWYHRRQRRA